MQCKNQWCGNYDERFANRCRALARVIPPEVCFAKMTHKQAKRVDEEIRDNLETGIAKSNRRYYQNKNEKRDEKRKESCLWKQPMFFKPVSIPIPI